GIFPEVALSQTHGVKRDSRLAHRHGRGSERLPSEGDRLRSLGSRPINSVIFRNLTPNVTANRISVNKLRRTDLHRREDQERRDKRRNSYAVNLRRSTDGNTERKRHTRTGTAPSRQICSARNADIDSIGVLILFALVLDGQAIINLGHLNGGISQDLNILETIPSTTITTLHFFLLRFGYVLWLRHSLTGYWAAASSPALRALSAK